MPQISTLSESLEDYLEIILQLVREKGEARVKDIAERKAVRMASVTGAIKRLGEEGLIEHRARETVTLTREGEELAERVLRRHKFIHRFLGEILGVSDDVAERDACSIEHGISLETLDRLAAFVEFLKACPQVGGDLPQRFRDCYELGQRLSAGAPAEDLPCREADCREGFPADSVGLFSRRARSLPLSELRPGDRARVTSLRAPKGIRQRLIDMGLMTGVELQMERVAPLGDPIEIKLKGFHLSLRKIEAGTITVELLP